MGIAERHDEHVAALLNLHGLVPAIVVANRLGVVSADVVDGPLIRVLARSLVLKEGEEQLLANDGIRVEE